MKGSVKLPVFIDDARKYVNTTQLRAKYLGASYEAEYCQWQTLHGLGSLMETASLIITPNAYLEGKLIASYPPDPIGDFDVTRATTATRVNSAGLVELVPYNVVQYSQEYSNSSFWSYYVSSVSANTATAPDGTLTADTLTLSATNGSTYQSFASQNAATFNLSTYFKKTNEDVVYMDCSSSGGYFGASFNLTTQAITTFGGGFSPLIESVGNGWYRCSVNGFVSGSGAFGVGVYSTAGQSAYIWGTQLNEGGLKDYQKTETRLNIPRLDYSNGTCPSLLVEPQRTNRILWSAQFTNATWSAIDTTISANTTISPEGIQNADTMAISSSTSRIFQYTGLGAGTYTASVYIKSLSGTPTIQFRMVVDGNDITDSIPTTTEWVRHDFTFTASASMDYFVLRGESGTGSVAIWGAQLEAGSYATSHIPTTSASVTRNADVVSKTGISSLIGQTEGTIFLDFVLKNPLSATNRIISLTESVWNTGGSIRLDIDFNQIKADFVNGGSNIGTITYSTTPLQNTRYKVAIAYKENDCQMYINGVDAGSDTTTGAMPTCSEFYLNALGGGFNAPYEASNINATALWKTRLTNTQLQTLTSI
jgi:hypothetical protein